MNDGARRRSFRQSARRNLRTGVRPVSTIGGGGNQNAEIQFTINGPDLKALERFAGAIAEAARKEPGVVDVDTSLNVGKPELSVNLDRLKAADLGVQISDAAEALRLLVGGDQVTTYNEGGEQYEVHVRAGESDRQTSQAIGQLTVPSSTVGSVAARERRAVYTGHGAVRNQPAQPATPGDGFCQGFCPVCSADARDVGHDARGGVAGNGTGLRHPVRGTIARAWPGRQNFLLAFGLSFVFMYLILAAQFESWLHPVTILLSLPLTLPFALLSHHHLRAVAQHLLGARSARAVRRREEELRFFRSTTPISCASAAWPRRSDAAGEPRSAAAHPHDDLCVRRRA